MAKKKVLVIEDEKSLSRVLKYNLEQEGYEALTADDGESGLALALSRSPDLILLDVMLPKLDGFEVCKALREKSKTPIIMLTAKKEEVDRVLGLELGADDYVTKPFSVRELMARIKAILRRTSEGGSQKAWSRAGALEIDIERYEVHVQGKPVALSPKEFELLKQLFEVDGRALSRDELLEKVWGYEGSMDIDSNTVDQHIARLRGKLGAEAARIRTVKNVGYRLKLD
jgi:DNA-binding response OmpR family regulator